MSRASLAIHQALVENTPTELDKLPPAWTISTGFNRSDDGATITHMRRRANQEKSGVGDAALGVPIWRRGVRVLTMTVPASAVEGDGGLYVGICDAGGPVRLLEQRRQP